MNHRFDDDEYGDLIDRNADRHECANCGARTTEMWHHHLDGVICDGCEAVRREQFEAAKANQAYARR